MRICFLTGHRWNSSGSCDRCRARCNHPVTVYERDRLRARCLDCGLVISPNDLPPAGLVTSQDRHAETIGRRLQRFIAGLFGWDEGPFS